MDEYQPVRKSVTGLNPVDNFLSGSWEALGAGAPVLVALAQLCSQAMVVRIPHKSTLADGLLPEAKAVLVAARKRGVIEVRGVNTAFDPAARLLAVYVEIDESQTIAKLPKTFQKQNGDFRAFGVPKCDGLALIDLDVDG